MHCRPKEALGPEPSRIGLPWDGSATARLSDPRYEEMILPDVTENPMYSTDDARDVAVTDELDDMEELDTRMGDAEANEVMRMMTWSRSKMTHRSRTTRRSMLGCVVFSVTSNNIQ